MLKSILTGFLTTWGLLCGCPISNKDCKDCDEFKFKIKMIGQLPNGVKESSGLVYLDDFFFTHGDSGNDAILYGFRYPVYEDTVELEIQMEEWTNEDWEDLAREDNKRIFIGDIGNNQNNRKDLKIISYDFRSQETFGISYRYGDQKEFPPQKTRQQNFDSEAIFWSDQKIYLFSKNKRSKFTKIYELNDSNTDQTIYPTDSIKLWNTPITAADISPDKKEIALLSYGKILFFYAGKENGQLHMVPKSCKKFRRSGQAEGITYFDNDHLLITNEKGKVFLVYRKYRNGSSEDTKLLPESILEPTQH